MKSELSELGARALRFVGPGGCTLVKSPDGAGMVLVGAGGDRLTVVRQALAWIAAEAFIALEGDKLRLTAAGRAFLSRRHPDGLQAQHRDIESREMLVDAGAHEVTINLAESPLAQLARRKGRDGRAFLSGDEIRAGERLRSDYTRGQIMPRLGANWVASISSGRRQGAGGATELTEAALSARQRVDAALYAVGPELSGLLVDVCCFLKGVEQVESERGWPVRSAKIVLKTALCALARHYEPAAVRQKKQARVLHWGAEDYRPVLAE